MRFCLFVLHQPSSQNSLYFSLIRISHHDLLSDRTMAVAGIEKRIRIAILGGSIVGATLARALVDYPHLDLQLYESASQLSEPDIAVEIAENGQRALQSINSEIYGLVKKGGAIRTDSIASILVSIHHFVDDAFLTIVEKSDRIST